MYLDYEKYKEYGGVLSNTDFDRFSFRAEREIDNATLNKCKNLTEIPEEVKRCEYELILFFSKNVQNGSVSSVASFSNDGYSVSYANPKDAEKQIRDIIYTYLSGTGLMYCGVD